MDMDESGRARPPATDEGGWARRRFRAWLHRPIRAWQAIVITILFGPLAAIFTLVGLVALVLAPPTGVFMLFGAMGGWFMVFYAWRMVGVDPVTLERPKDAKRRRQRGAHRASAPGVTSSSIEGLPVGAVDPAGAQQWRSAIASVAAESPPAPAVRLVFRVESGGSAPLARLVVPVLAGLRDAGVFVQRDGAEALIAEKVVDEARPGVNIALLNTRDALAMSPPGPVARTIASAAPPPAGDHAATRSERAGDEAGGFAGGAWFVDAAVRDPRSLEALLPAVMDALLPQLGGAAGEAGADRGGEQVTWLRVHRAPHLPVALVGAVGSADLAVSASPPATPPQQPAAPATSVVDQPTAPSGIQPTLYTCVDPRRSNLALVPRLASWDAKESPSQRRLGEYLDHVEQLADLDRYGAGVPLGLLLDVGLGRELTTDDRGYDLDNYLFPVANRLGANRFVLFRATKSAAATSTIAVGPAAPATHLIDGGWNAASLATATAADSAAWKQELIAQLAGQVTAPPRLAMVEVELAFRVGPRRNWANLWKPAIDSLGAIVGLPDATRPYHPRDDLIVSLGLHRTVDPDLGNAVRIDVWWRRSDQ